MCFCTALSESVILGERRLQSSSSPLLVTRGLKHWDAFRKFARTPVLFFCSYYINFIIGSVLRRSLSSSRFVRRGVQFSVRQRPVPDGPEQRQRRALEQSGLSSPVPGGLPEGLPKRRGKAVPATGDDRRLLRRRTVFHGLGPDPIMAILTRVVDRQIVSGFHFVDGRRLGVQTDRSGRGREAVGNPQE